MKKYEDFSRIFYIYSLWKLDINPETSACSLTVLFLKSFFIN